ncbi:hypothetical protein Ahia01_000383400 [Argonauta hians]
MTSPKTRLNSSPSSSILRPRDSMVGILPHSLPTIKELRDYDMESFFGCAASNWMLSTDQYRLNTSPPIGLIGGSSLPDSYQCVLLLEEDSSIKPLDYREIHQMIRELTNGIYVLNQSPTISLETNFDLTSTCNLPPAYDNTKVGQLLIEVDYMMKALWHGLYLPKHKRSKFLDKWRAYYKSNSYGVQTGEKMLNPTEFTGIGMVDLMKDPDLAPLFLKLSFDNYLSNDTFSALSDVLSIQMLLSQKDVSHHQDLFIINTQWSVSSKVVLNSDNTEPETLASLNLYLEQQCRVVSEALTVEADTRRKLVLVKLVAFLSTFLVTMRKRMRIPDKDHLLRPLHVDDCRTETDLPPLILSPDSQFSFFRNEGPHLHLHGGISVNYDTPPPSPAPAVVVEAYSALKKSALEQLSELLSKDHPLSDHHYTLPVHTIDNKRYYTIAIEFETYYPQIPQEPLWIRTYQEELTKLKSKLPMNIENNLFEVFKKHLGFNKAIKCKNQSYALRMSAQKGLLPAFRHYCRKIATPRTLSKHDESGYGLLHHAAIHNRPAIIVLLLQHGLDIDVRRHNLTSVGPSALHLAVQCGAFDAVACLVCNSADISAVDSHGWTPIHCAAFYNQSDILEVFLRRDKEFTEIQTRDNRKSTPLLLAATSGSLSVVSTLLRFGADVTGSDLQGHNVIHVAVLHGHTHIVRHFIQLRLKHLPVWSILVDMLQFHVATLQEYDVTDQEYDVTAEEGDVTAEESDVTVLESDVTVPESDVTVPETDVTVLETDFTVLESDVTVPESDVTVPERDVTIHQSDVTIQQSDVTIQQSDVICAVRCLEEIILSEPQYWSNIYDIDGVTALAKLLESSCSEVLALTSSILCNITENIQVQELLTTMDIGRTLVRLLTSSVPEVQARVSILISDLASSIELNQKIFAEQGAIRALIQLLHSDNEQVLINTMNALRVLCLANSDNQSEVARWNGIPALTHILNTHSDSKSVQSATAASLAAISLNHFHNQCETVATGAVLSLVKLTLSRDIELQVKGARTIEALTENNPDNQTKFLKMGAAQSLVQLLKDIDDSVREQGMCALWTLAGHTRPQQKIVAETIGIPNIMKMLLHIKSEKLLLVGCLSAIGLVKEDMVQQKQLVDAEVLPQLVRLLHNKQLAHRVTAMVVKLLGVLCIGVAYTNNQFVQSKMAQEGTIPVLVQLLDQVCTAVEMTVEVVTTLACIVLHNTTNQQILQNETKFNWDYLLPLLQSPSQIVVLARVITGCSCVTLTATGVTILVETLQSQDDDVVILAASLLSSLAHTRAGITDAMVTVGALQYLIEKLTSSTNCQVSSAIAVTLGYLTFNPTAFRHLLTACRNTPGLYKTISKHLKVNSKINRNFIENFKLACHIGLPSQYLEINGGLPVTKPSRPRTGHQLCENSLENNLRKVQKQKQLRTKSALCVRQTSKPPVLYKSVTNIETSTQLP